MKQWRQRLQQQLSTINEKRKSVGSSQSASKATTSRSKNTSRSNQSNRTKASRSKSGTSASSKPKSTSNTSKTGQSLRSSRLRSKTTAGLYSIKHSIHKKAPKQLFPNQKNQSSTAAERAKGSRNAKSSGSKNATKAQSQNTKRTTSAGKEATKGKTAATRTRHKKQASRPTHSRHRKAAAITGPPDTWWRRWLWYMNPRRFRDWWFSKPGLLAALRIAGVAAGIFVVLILGLFLYFARDLPTAGQINAATQDMTTRIFDRSGEEVLYEVFGEEDRRFVELENIGENVRNATVAIEDRNFYDQGAFSSLGILRASVNNVLDHDDGLQGGSTITQQYVKNALLTPERTITRKIRELIIAMQMEELFEKDEILELYLNEIGYGAQAYGAQAASQMYFSKDADELDNIEAAMLAALPQAPTFYSPYGENTEALIERTHIVIDLMEEQGYLSEEEAQEAKEQDLLARVNDTPDAYRDIQAPHFVLSVQQELEEEFGSQEFAQGGYDVITTLDLDKQRAAEKAVKDNIGTVEQGGGNNAALVSSDPSTGQVLAMVGSRGFEQKDFGSYNAATAKRQPGSSFKPYVYAQAFEDTTDWGAGSIMYDVPTNFGGNYRPDNFDNSFRDNLTVRHALAESRNIPAVKMLYIVGLSDTLQTAEELGITTLRSEANYGLSLVLGSGEVQLDEHVNGYETFANGGVHHEQTKVLEVRDNDGNVVKEWQKSDGERVFSKQTSYLISDILSDDNARAPTFGHNSPNLSVPGHDVAIKTGTTDDLRDGWMMGYSRDLTAGVWTGHNDNEPMHTATSNLTGPIFTQYMRQVLEGKERKPFQRPDGIKTIELDRYTGTRPTDESEGTVTDIFPSWYEPEAVDEDEIETATINSASDRRVDDNCRPHEDYIEEIANYGLEPEIPPDDPAYPRWNAPVQDLADRLDIGSRQSIPDEKDDCDDEPTIDSMDAESDNGDVKITVKVDQSVDEVTVRHDGDGDVGSPDSTSNKKYVFSHTPASEGDHDYEATAINNGLYDTASDTCSGCGEDSSEDIEDDDNLPLDNPGNQSSTLPLHAGIPTSAAWWIWTRT